MKRKKKPKRPKLLRFYRRYLMEEDAARFVRSVAAEYQLPTLAVLATRGPRVVRRAAVLALSMLGDMRMNDVLGRALLDGDRGVRLLADQSLRQIWLRDGNPAQQSKLAIATQLNLSFQFEASHELTSQLIDEAPRLAEAFHQRAIACACLGAMASAVNDCQRALELNPYHFAAAAAMGQAYCELENRSSAMECFEIALQINPDLEGVRARLQQLQRMP